MAQEETDSGSVYEQLDLFGDIFERDNLDLLLANLAGRTSQIALGTGADVAVEVAVLGVPFDIKNNTVLVIVDEISFLIDRRQLADAVTFLTDQQTLRF